MNGCMQNLKNEIGTSEEKTYRFLLPHTTQRVELRAAVMESGEVALTLWSPLPNNHRTNRVAGSRLLPQPWHGGASISDSGTSPLPVAVRVPSAEPLWLDAPLASTASRLRYV
jgi:hypothetical protein